MKTLLFNVAVCCHLLVFTAGFMGGGPECAIDMAEREECGNFPDPTMIDSMECTMPPLNCCYDSTAFVNACYKKKTVAPPTAAPTADARPECQVNIDDRFQCGDANTEAKCKDYNCCYDSVNKKCYKATGPSAGKSATAAPTAAPTAAARPECDVPVGARFACGDAGSDEQKCSAYNCCFDSAIRKCYKATGTLGGQRTTALPTAAPTAAARPECDVPIGSRFECGDAGSDEAKCRAYNCCFDSGNRKCYKATGGKTAAPKAAVTTAAGDDAGDDAGADASAGEGKCVRKKQCAMSRR